MSTQGENQPPAGKPQPLAALAFLPQVLLIVFSLSALILMAFAIYFDQAKPRIFGNLVMMIGLSSMVVILASAAIYVEAGLKNTGTGVEPGEAIYFSTVAFSTLGFGDITPADSFSRAMAALEAVIGNIHLALFTGAAFFIISNGPTDPDAPAQPYPAPNTASNDTAKTPNPDTLPNA